MNCLAFALFLTFAVYATSAQRTAEKTRQIVQPVYTANRYPYNYGRYDVVNYDYGGYRRYDPRYNYDTYPYVGDLSSHSLHLSGGIFRPHGYDDHVNYPGYSPYVYDNKYYERAASTNSKYPYTYNRGY